MLTRNEIISLTDGLYLFIMLWRVSKRRFVIVQTFDPKPAGNL